MKATIGFILGVCVLGASAPGALGDTIANPSFETGDYTGWVLMEDHPPGPASAGAWGVLADGTTLSPGDAVFDHHDTQIVNQSSTHLPMTFSATDGQYVAVQLQNHVQYHRMYQDILLPSDATTLSWDMFYDSTGAENTGSGGFLGGPKSDPAALGQYLAVVLRSPTDDSLLATLFWTASGDPLGTGMLPYTAGIAAYAGTSVRLSVEIDVDYYFFDAAFDDFQVEGTPIPEPVSLALLGLGTAGLAVHRRRKRRNAA